MSIGKNSIRRAVNNGYSKVKTSAPDMENSEVLETVAPVATSAAVQPAVKKTATKKTTAKTTAVKRTVLTPPTAVAESVEVIKEKPVKKTVEKKATAKNNVAKKSAQPKVKKAYVNFGEELPFYLL